MRIILASSNDALARKLTARWPDTLLLTPRDLSRCGWRYDVPAPPGPSGEEWAGRAVAAGAMVRTAAISAVYTRLPGIFAHDLADIRIDDREYVAAEMNAFLLSWLTSLRCTVVNRPTIMGLAGPNLRPEAWTQRAAEAGIPVRCMARGSDGYEADAPQPPTRQVTIIGSACFGETDELARRWARNLADQMGLTLLTVAFEWRAGPTNFLQAHPWPDLTAPGVENAVLDLLCAPETPAHREAA
jgi:hypothetical protein